MAVNTPAAAPQHGRKRPADIRIRHWQRGSDSHTKGQQEAARVRQLTRCPAEYAIRQLVVCAAAQSDDDRALSDEISTFMSRGDQSLTGPRACGLAQTLHPENTQANTQH